MEGDTDNKENILEEGQFKSTNKLVLILIALLAIAFLAWFISSGSYGNGDDLIDDTSAISSQPKDHVTGDRDNINFLGVVTHENIGTYFTHPDTSMALYTMDGECTGECLNDWTPYTGDTEWIDGDLRTITKKDTGKLQYTWLNMGLYTFNNDLNDGDVLGDGFTEGAMIARP